MSCPSPLPLLWIKLIFLYNSENRSTKNSESWICEVHETYFLSQPAISENADNLFVKSKTWSLSLSFDLLKISDIIWLAKMTDQIIIMKYSWVQTSVHGAMLKAFGDPKTLKKHPQWVDDTIREIMYMQEEKWQFKKERTAYQENESIRFGK